MRLVGYDPGGKGQFGWCVVEATDSLPLAVRASDVADSARDADRAVRRALDGEEPAAIGIDSPLFWVESGDRRADATVRVAIEGLGAKHAHGTVQQVNSLRGACLVQGLLVAKMARSCWPNVRITESHPKALLWLLGVASKDRPASEVGIVQLADYLTCPSGACSEHERDAALASLGAWAMLTQRSGWKNLVHLEEAEVKKGERFVWSPVPDVEYWMPGLNVGTAKGVKISQ
jgi:hypothetical protein